MRGRANLDLTFEAFEFVGLSGGTSLASVPSYEKKGLCLLIPFLSVGGLSSVAAGGLRLSSSIAVDSLSVEDSIHEE